MKIALIGDLQYKHGEQETLRGYMAQIASWQPDLAVFLGDMGPDGMRGTKEGMLDCRGLFDLLPCETIALLGNHDVEYRPDSKTRFHRPEQWRREVFGSETPWRAVRTERFQILCLSTERQPEETLLTQHALYSSEEQYQWARAQLESHPALPTIILSHAPVAGSGLRCCPPVHHAATDAFMGQNFDPKMWTQLLRDHKQIFLWASAHFHMGHGYDRAITDRGGVVHASCGVMCSCSRDGTRQTRLMETLPGGTVRLLTMDHLAGGTVAQDAEVYPDGRSPRGRFCAPDAQEILIGDDHAVAAWDSPETGRVFIATQAGRLWEYDRNLSDLTGTLCVGEQTNGAALNGGRIFVQGASGVFSADANAPTRFLRLSGFVPQERRAEEAMPEEGLLHPIAFTTHRESEGEYVTLPKPT